VFIDGMAAMLVGVTKTEFMNKAICKHLVEVRIDARKMVLSTNLCLKAG